MNGKRHIDCVHSLIKHNAENTVCEFLYTCEIMAVNDSENGNSSEN